MKLFLKQRMTNNVRFTSSVGETTWAVYNSYQAKQIELVTLNTIYGVVAFWLDQITTYWLAHYWLVFSVTWYMISP